jgi:hypothetical protein
MAAVTIGITVMGLAIFFLTSKFGIFNLMQAFFTLFNIPVTVPIAFGLIFRRVPKWSAVGAITWGLIVGATARYVLGWDIGPQVYLSFVMTFAIFSTSQWTGKLYLTNKTALILICIGISAAMGYFFSSVVMNDVADWQRILALVSAVALGASLYGFARFFALETEDDKRIVKEFFKKIDTPIDMAKEVFINGRKQVSTLPIVGRTMIFLGILVCFSFINEMTHGEAIAVGVMSAILISFGSFMWLYGKRSERRGETQAH